jgi:hypothetical protein
VPEYQAWNEQAQSFELIGAMFGSTQSRILGAAEGGQPAESLQTFALERDLLDVWGIQPLLGRLFTADEDVVGDMLLNRFQQKSAPVVYVPYAQQTPVLQGQSAQYVGGGMWFLVRRSSKACAIS